MGCAATTIRIVLALLNLVLFIAFIVVGVVGCLLKFNSAFINDMLQKIAPQWLGSQTAEMVTIVQHYGSTISVTLIILGFVVAGIALLGVISLFCKVRFIAGIYIFLVALLCIVELVLIIYFFAIAGNLMKTLDNVMDKSLKEYGKGGALSDASVVMWNAIGSTGDVFCCGYNGYQDFDELLPPQYYPSACCNKNFSQMLESEKGAKCELAEARELAVSGCKTKIINFVDSYKDYFIGVSCGLLIFQLFVLIVMSVLCKSWRPKHDA